MADQNPGIIVEKNPSQDRLDELKFKSWPKWACAPGKFHLKYEAEEICYIVKGKVKVYPRTSSSTTSSSSTASSSSLDAEVEWCVEFGAEKKREGLDDILQLADYVVCTEKFPQAWTEVASVPCSLESMLLRLPKLKFVIVTLGEEGCLMIQRASQEASESKETDIESLVETLMHRVDSTATFPTCVASETTKLKANGIGTLSGRLFLGTAEKVPPEELVDTTGAGDAFIRAVLYAVCAGMPPEKMLPFSAQVAACNSRALGARTGLPHRSDPRLAPFLV